MTQVIDGRRELSAHEYALVKASRAGIVEMIVAALGPACTGDDVNAAYERYVGLLHQTRGSVTDIQDCVRRAAQWPRDRGPSSLHAGNDAKNEPERRPGTSGPLPNRPAKGTA